MTISDETLMAYLDGELSAEERTRIAAIIERDGVLKARLARQERVLAALKSAFDPALGQQVPERLVSAALTAPVSWRFRLRQTASQLFGGGEANFVPRSAVFAATLLAGVALGLAFQLMQGGSSLVAPEGERLMAQGPLADVLSQGLASENQGEGARVGVTFRSKTGALCRTFETGSQTENLAGVACRTSGGWTVTTLTQVPPRRNPYELAGSGMPAAIRGVVDEMIDGEPLDAAQERRARDEGWR